MELATRIAIGETLREYRRAAGLVNGSRPRSCDLFHLEAAYDRLVELLGSKEVADVLIAKGFGISKGGMEI